MRNIASFAHHTTTPLSRVDAGPGRRAIRALRSRIGLPNRQDAIRPERQPIWNEYGYDYVGTMRRAYEALGKGDRLGFTRPLAPGIVRSTLEAIDTALGEKAIEITVIAIECELTRDHLRSLTREPFPSMSGNGTESSSANRDG